MIGNGCRVSVGTAALWLLSLFVGSGAFPAYQGPLTANANQNPDSERLQLRCAWCSGSECRWELQCPRTRRLRDSVAVWMIFSNGRCCYSHRSQVSAASTGGQGRNHSTSHGLLLLAVIMPHSHRLTLIHLPSMIAKRNTLPVTLRITRCQWSNSHVSGQLGPRGISADTSTSFQPTLKASPPFTICTWEVNGAIYNVCSSTEDGSSASRSGWVSSLLAHFLCLPTLQCCSLKTTTPHACTQAMPIHRAPSHARYM